MKMYFCSCALKQLVLNYNKCSTIDWEIMPVYYTSIASIYILYFTVDCYILLATKIYISKIENTTQLQSITKRLKMTMGLLEKKIKFDLSNAGLVHWHDFLISGRKTDFETNCFNAIEQKYNLIILFKKNKNMYIIVSMTNKTYRYQCLYLIFLQVCSFYVMYFYKSSRNFSVFFLVSSTFFSKTSSTSKKQCSDIFQIHHLRNV